MLAALKALFAPEAAEEPSDEHAKHLACAALMAEVACIDRDFDQREQQALLTALQAQFKLSDDECKRLSERAEEQRNDATSLHQFTRDINEQFNNNEKFSLLVDMWRIAYADGELDKYEEHIIRRVADLIHMGHSQFIRAKLEAQAS
ncbi:TerB family tellurite resistance protein [Agaribacterium sp. ZY112]|uniref:tellurite resistance TerB family protein n=1 Tax=Agaribacterium sp. ZY112 TaxID=3233574 RepID=UPI0035257395